MARVPLQFTVNGAEQAEFVEEGSLLIDVLRDNAVDSVAREHHIRRPRAIADSRRTDVRGCLAGSADGGSYQLEADSDARADHSSRGLLELLAPRRFVGRQQLQNS